MSRRQRKLDAINWGIDEAERELRDEPAHRLRNGQEGRRWFFEAPPTGRGVWVKTGVCRAIGTSAIEITLRRNRCF
jgi:hypothetical protein